MKLEDLRFDEQGLIPTIVQHAGSGEVLTLAYMNAESLARTLETKETWFWSRSRQELWHKGETSGNTQRVAEIRFDCDGDAIIVLVEPAGPACHTGQRSCFHHEMEMAEGARTAGHFNEEFDLGIVLRNLHELIEDRQKEQPPGSYTTYLFEQGLDKILKKIGEEAAETIIAAKNDTRDALVAETSDLLYHLIVLLVERKVGLQEIGAELSRRGGERQGK